MQIIVKGLKGFEVYPENKDYIERRFGKFAKMVKEPTILEFAFNHTHQTRATIDKGIRLTFTMPELKNPEHLEEVSEHFPETIDRLAKRFEEILRRHREKETEATRNR